MSRMNLDHWFIKDDELSISLMNFYVSICIKDDEELEDETKKVQLTTYDENMEKINFRFPSLEEAVVFTEEKMAKRFNTVDVIKDYQEYYEQTYGNKEEIVNKPVVKKKTIKKQNNRRQG